LNSPAFLPSSFSTFDIRLKSYVCFNFACNAKLKDERTIELAKLESNLITLEAAKFKQKIKVVISSSGAPVSAIIFLEKDEGTGKSLDEFILAKEAKSEEFTLEADIPAKEAAVIAISNAGNEKATVKVKITN
jgi:hypothetical protein